MRTLLCLLAGIFMCHTAVAQTPAKAGTAAAKALTASGEKAAVGALKKIPSAAVKARATGSLRPTASVRPTASLRPTGSVRPTGQATAKRRVKGTVHPGTGKAVLNTNALERAVTQQALAAKKAKQFAAKSIRRQVASGRQSAALLDQILQVYPSAVRADLLQDEFLTLTVRRGVVPSSRQLNQALPLFRTDLIRRIQLLQQSASAEPSPEVLQEAARAAADVSALGFYGSEKDARLILDFYRSCASGALEPVAFTASARALTALKAYPFLQQLLASARPSYAQEQFAAFAAQQHLPVTVPLAKEAAAKTDFSAWEKTFSKVSRVAAMQLDVSADATQKYLALKPSRAVSAPKHETAASQPKPAAVQAAVTAESVQPEPVPADVQPASAAPENHPTETAAADHSGVLYAGLPVMEWGRKIANWFKPSQEGKPKSAAKNNGEYQPVVPVLDEIPRAGLISREYPSGLKDEEGIIRNWMEYYTNGYFRPRDQVEAIEGMSAAKANNVMEYLYYMPLDEAERVILNPIRETGRLPDFMYDDRLIVGTRRLPAGYYKNKFNENVRRFVELAEEDGSIYTHNVELIDLATTMADYSFKQGFRYKNDPRMTAWLRHNWKELVDEIRGRGLKADRNLINRLWRKHIRLDDGTSVSLKDYFTQTRPTAFFAEGRMPEFFLNSEKWVAWENERRDLAEAEYISQFKSPNFSWWDKFQNWLVLGKPSNFLTLDQFGQVMTAQYKKSFSGRMVEGETIQINKNVRMSEAVRVSEADYVAGVSPSVLEDANPSSLTMQINNFDKIGGVCQMSFADGGYAGRVREGYDGTSTIHRFTPVNFEHVRAVTFNVENLQPQVVTLNSVPYLKDLKAPDLDQVRAGTMVSDGLDPTRDLIGVRQAEAALTKIPHLKATIYPHARLIGYKGERPAYLNGGGLAGYLALFTPDFYPVKTVYRLRFKGMKPYLEKEYFIRKEVPALAGLVHRDRLTFTQQLQDRVEPNGSVEKTQEPATAPEK